MNSLETPPPPLANFTGRRVTVMGLGQFGGGIGAVRFLLDRGAQVTVTDLRTAEQLAESLRQIGVERLAGLALGEHRPEDFEQADLIVVNPAVKPGHRLLERARAAGVLLSSEMNLFWQHCRGRKIVVTGSTGKSTTASLLAQGLLSAGRRAWLGGNIGVSLLPHVDDIAPDDWVVLELSSFQLADLARLQPRPDVAVVTNFFPNHLDWHGTLDDYREAKQAALNWQRPEDIAVLNADDPDVPLWLTDARVVWFGRETFTDLPGVSIGKDALQIRDAQRSWTVPATALAPALRSPHGLRNVAAAAGALVGGIGLTLDDIFPALQNFEPLPHRLQTLGEIAGRTFINDSKATTPEATIAALRSVAQPILLIAGGKDKGVDLSALADEIAQRAKGVALIGDTAETLAQQILAARRADQSTPPALHLAASLDDAVRWAWPQSAAGDAILLSPGCASHAEFANYERRGERFGELIQTLSDDPDSRR
jgi:UDP-N-acetylmuramoylalanine--D-glutamate ligase